MTASTAIMGNRGSRAAAPAVAIPPRAVATPPRPPTRVVTAPNFEIAAKE